MGEFLATVAIGFVAGVLSGMFGIGGGVVTTPAIRLLLEVPALVAVGTPLVAIVPSAVTGAISYSRHGLADLRAGLVIGATGSLTAVIGAMLGRLVGGPVVLVVTAVLLLYVAVDMVLQALRPPRVGLAAAEEADAVDTHALDSFAEEPTGPARATATTRWMALAAIGVVAGLYSGFLGVGGGFVVVPLLTRWLRFPLKRAVGTSLVAVGLLSIPGTITHALLGNIDWAIGLGLVVGVIPGAALGARIALGAKDRALRLGFAVLLGLVGLWLAGSEIAGLAR